MQQPLGSTGQPVTTNEDVKKQFSQGPQAQTPPTQEELEEHRKKREEFLDKNMSFLRKEAEYSRLQMELTELDVLMGRMSPAQVPGLLGQELMVRDVQARHFMHQYWLGQEAANKASEEEKKMREEFDKLSPEEQAKWQEEAMKKVKESGMVDIHQSATGI